MVYDWVSVMSLALCANPCCLCVVVVGRSCVSRMPLYLLRTDPRQTDRQIMSLLVPSSYLFANYLYFAI